MMTMSTLKVVYSGQLNTDLDESLTALAEKYGYELVGQGYNMKAGERDISFEMPMPMGVKDKKDG